MLSLYIFIYYTWKHMRFVQHRAYSILNMSHDGMQMSYLNEMSYAGRWPYDPAWIKKLTLQP